MRKPIQRRDRSERQPRRHHQGIIPAFVTPGTELSDHRIQAEDLRNHLPAQQSQENERSGNQGRDGNEHAGAKEIERGEKPDRQSAQTTKPEGILVRELGQRDTHEIGGKHRLAARPKRHGAQTKKHQDHPFGADGRGSIGIYPGQPLGGDGQRRQHEHGRRDEDNALVSERREQQSERDDRAEIVDEAGAQNTLAEIRLVEAGLQHHRVDHRHRRGRKRDAAQQTGLRIPAQQVIGDGRAAKERRQEADKADDRYFLQLPADDLRLKLGAGEEREQNRARGSKKLQPLQI